MRVLLVSWEYPPVVVGGLGRHVHHLALQLRDQGHDVVVVSRQPTGTDPRSHPTSDAVVDGIRVIMAAEDPLALDFGTDMMAWTLAMGHAMVRAGLALGLKGSGDWRPDVVHAHGFRAGLVAATVLGGPPTVISLHNPVRGSGASPRRLVGQTVAQAVMRRADLVTGASSDLVSDALAMARSLGPTLRHLHLTDGVPGLLVRAIT